MIDNYDDVVEALKPFLVQYLEKQGIEASDSKHFLCLNPEHEDHHPSCRIIPEEPGLAYCHGCKESFNIFHAAHYLEGKPLTGPGFITDNLAYLARLFEVPIKLRPLTPDEQYRQKIFQAYQAAADYVAGTPLSPRAAAEIERRGWDAKRVRNLGVGCVPDFQTFHQHLLDEGWEADFLNAIDLGFTEHRPSMIFNRDILIFTIQDEYGRPCGFAGRNLNYNAERDHDRKYINTATLLHGDIYRKSERLYGLHQCRNSQPLYIVEGYADRLTLFLQGFTNVVALGGTAFTEKHLQKLLKLGYRDLILALDGDKSGQKRTEKLIEGYLAGTKDLRIRVLAIPNDLDPDEFVRQRGIEAWKELEVQSAFSWRLDRFAPGTEGRDICEAMIPIIVNEPKAIQREQMAKELALRTGFHFDSIFADLKRELNVKEAERRDHKEAVIKQGAREALQNPDNAALALRQAVRQLEDMDKLDNRDVVSSLEFVDALEVQANFERSKAPVEEIFHLGPKLKDAEQIFSGAAIKRAMVILGGVPNCGKTNLLSQLAIEFVQHNPNVTVIFHTIDDDRQELVTKLLMHLLGDEAGDIELNWLMNPNYHMRFDPGIQMKHKIAYDRLITLAKQQRIIVKDTNIGYNLNIIDSLLSYYREQLPDRDLIYILDNFSLLEKLGTSESQEDHNRLRETSAAFKRILKQNQVMGIMTQEYTKLKPDTKPCYNDLKGSSGIPHDANIIMHLYNDMHARQQNTEFFHLDKDGNKLPTVEWIFEKSKVNKFKGRSLYIDMIPHKAQFQIVPNDEVLLRQARAKEANDNVKPKVLWKNGSGTEVPKQNPQPRVANC